MPTYYLLFLNQLSVSIDNLGNETAVYTAGCLIALDTVESLTTFLGLF